MRRVQHSCLTSDSPKGESLYAILRVSAYRVYQEDLPKGGGGVKLLTERANRKAG
ncbi:hypothetical protein [Treponema endosymbiont of Eucomonympha sp.]|uniref:hypothetical protein n=1 Tax=Treponema endosymbiont of Eucomonympha sp. TaxID=1580831 RepID=UPI000ACE4C22|nr:hypothetical protein [Treponema endosymbiont of Eucomonympha sp.]